MGEAHDAVAHVLARPEHGPAIRDSLLFGGHMVGRDIHPGLLKNSGDIEGDDGLPLFGIEGEILGDVVGQSIVENLLGIDIKAIPEKAAGDLIRIADLDEVSIAIEIVEDIAQKIFVADFTLEGILEEIGEAILDRIEVIVEALPRTFEILADVGNGHFRKNGRLHFLPEFGSELVLTFVHLSSLDGQASRLPK